MLVGARDKDGTPNLFGCEIGKYPVLENGNWVESDGTDLIFCDDAEPFCRNIPPGERRIIDTANLVVPYLPEPKSAMEELVEACEGLLTECQNKTHARVGMAHEAVFSALNRVKQEVTTSSV